MKSNLLRKGDKEGSKIGNFVAELNDLLSRGRDDVVRTPRGTVKDDGDSRLIMGDFWGEGSRRPLVCWSIAVDDEDDTGVRVPESSSIVDIIRSDERDRLRDIVFSPSFLDFV